MYRKVVVAEVDGERCEYIHNEGIGAPQFEGMVNIWRP